MNSSDLDVKHKSLPEREIPGKISDVISSHIPTFFDPHNPTGSHTSNVKDFLLLLQHIGSKNVMNEIDHVVKIIELDDSMFYLNMIKNDLVLNDADLSIKKYVILKFMVNMIKFILMFETENIINGAKLCDPGVWGILSTDTFTKNMKHSVGEMLKNEEAEDDIINKLSVFCTNTLFSKLHLCNESTDYLRLPDTIKDDISHFINNSQLIRLCLDTFDIIFRNDDHYDYNDIKEYVKMNLISILFFLVWDIKLTHISRCNIVNKTTFMENSVIIKGIISTINSQYHESISDTMTRINKINMRR